MFQPSLVKLAGDPLHRVILNSINSFTTDDIFRKDLRTNIVLAGGYGSIVTEGDLCGEWLDLIGQFLWLSVFSCTWMSQICLLHRHFHPFG
jgi:hypothetical protein